jgi:hypothetical protein
MLFLCPRAKKVWQNLDLDLKILEACATDLAGQVVLEYQYMSLARQLPLKLMQLQVGIYGGKGDMR